MSLSPLDVPGLLRQWGLRADKRLSQNFLVDEVALERVVDAAGILPSDVVLEIGAGLGSLTRHLALAASRVAAVEVDEKLIPPLRQVLAPFPNVTLVQGDILSLDPARLALGETGEDSYQVVANIPYSITSILIRHLLETGIPPDRLVLTVQREVAERICAAPGEMSLLALSVQVYGAAELAAHIPAGAFYPAPRVDSAVVRVERYARPRIPPGDLDAFFRLAKAGFSQKRKTLRNSISAGMGWSTGATEIVLRSAQVDAQRRAETLSIEEWGSLVQAARAAPGGSLAPGQK